MVNSRFYKPMKFILACLACSLLIYESMSWLGVIFLGSNPFDNNPFDNSKFDQAIWNEDATVFWAGNRRAGMAEDILNHRLKHGMTMKAVIDLLNEPTSKIDRAEMKKEKKRFPVVDKLTYRVLSYYLGEELGSYYVFGNEVDTAWLDLRFDSGGNYIGGELFVPH